MFVNALTWSPVVSSQAALVGTHLLGQYMFGLDLICLPPMHYGVKYIDLVSLAPFIGQPSAEPILRPLAGQSQIT